MKNKIISLLLLCMFILTSCTSADTSQGQYPDITELKDGRSFDSFTYLYEETTERECLHDRSFYNATETEHQLLCSVCREPMGEEEAHIKGQYVLSDIVLIEPEAVRVYISKCLICDSPAESILTTEFYGELMEEYANEK